MNDKGRPKPRLGFVGIGFMGEAMTRRLLERGWCVTAWNLEPDRLDRVVPYGAVAAGSPAARPTHSDLPLVRQARERFADFVAKGHEFADPATLAALLHDNACRIYRL
ncbi:MAG: NAD(P)-binding domain-containing protein [Burkholderiaceae bacterium]